MRNTTRLFATVKSAAKYLEANTPTGLTGLPTHPAPRPALIYTYRETLNKLKQLPSSSVYRQSTEALTKHRLKIVEETKPEGYDAWFERVTKQIEASPEAYAKLKNSDGSLGHERVYAAVPDAWDGLVKKTDVRQEGVNTMAEADKKATLIQQEIAVVEKADKEGDLPSVDDLEIEPPLTADQINAIEVQIAAGLIEEVLQVAEGELELVDEMMRNQVWEPLEEQIPSGQWEYFERGDRV